jgi:membrane protease YdiL (CAAX protease family)
MHFLKQMDWQTFLHLDEIALIPIAYGLEFGIVYAFLAILILKAPIFEKIPLQIDKLVKDLRLTYFDAIFLSFCAGLGEELLFRAGIQPFLGIWPTSILFVAIHGYLSIKKPKMSLYGLVVLPFIVLISYGFESFGLWFSVAAHFSYDLVLFLGMISEDKE